MNRSLVIFFFGALAATPVVHSQPITDGIQQVPGPQARITGKPLDAEQMAGVQKIAAQLLVAKKQAPARSDDETAVADELEHLRQQLVGNASISPGSEPAIVVINGATTPVAEHPRIKAMRGSVTTLKSRRAEFARRRDKVANKACFDGLLAKMQAVEDELALSLQMEPVARTQKLQQLATQLERHKLSEEIVPNLQPAITTRTEHRH